MNVNWKTAAATLAGVAMLATGAQAQGRYCAAGRGIVVADLGFERLDAPLAARRISNGQVFTTFKEEPTVRDVRAGTALREGDVLVAIDGHAITSAEGSDRYSTVRPGERVELTVRRGGRLERIVAAAGERCLPLPPAPPAPPTPPPPPAAPIPPPAEVMTTGLFGFEIECEDCGKYVFDSTVSLRFGKPPVISAVEPSGPAARAGLRAGDRLTHVGGASLLTEAGWRRFGRVQPGERVEWTIVRDGQERVISVSARQPPDRRQHRSP